jgi:hypothetical protein
MTETQLQNYIIELAGALGYRHYHPYDSRKSQPGFPDLTLVKGTRLIFAELKSAKGTTSPEQIEWLAALRGTSAEVYLWRPCDWVDGSIEKVLLGR